MALYFHTNFDVSEAMSAGASDAGARVASNNPEGPNYLGVKRKAEMEAYDALPVSVRAALRNAKMDFNSAQALGFVKTLGARETAKLIKENDRKLSFAEMRRAFGPTHPSVGR